MGSTMVFWHCFDPSEKLLYNAFQGNKGGSQDSIICVMSWMNDLIVLSYQAYICENLTFGRSFVLELPIQVD